jgi:hypothetical protein
MVGNNSSDVDPWWEQPEWCKLMVGTTTVMMWINGGNNNRNDANQWWEQQP